MWCVSGAGLFGASFVDGVLASDRISLPREALFGAGVIDVSACSVFPLSFGGEALLLPSAEGQRFFPSHKTHRFFGREAMRDGAFDGQSFALRRKGDLDIRTSVGFNTCAVRANGDFGAVDPKAADVDFA